MGPFSLEHLTDADLIRNLTTAVHRERGATALVVAHIGEVDVRRLYVAAGYSSMFAYCVGSLRLSEHAAYARIRAARTCREFPSLFLALADGRIHLSGLCLLSPHLTEDNVEDLLGACTHRSKSEIEGLLAQRFARPASSAPAPLIRALPSNPVRKLVPERVGRSDSQGVAARALLAERETEGNADPDLLSPTSELDGAVRQTEMPARGARDDAPMQTAEAQYLLRCTISKSTHDKLRYAQDLLGHSLPSGDLPRVLDLALEALIQQLESRKFAATQHPRTQNVPSRSRRHVPAAVRRAVFERDGGRCTYVSPRGHRCNTRKRLEFDHVDPVALGGKPSIDRIRLRCRAHNQYEADLTFGPAFMEGKRGKAAGRTTNGTRSADDGDDSLVKAGGHERTP